MSFLAAARSLQRGAAASMSRARPRYASSTSGAPPAEGLLDVTLEKLHKMPTLQAWTLYYAVTVVLTYPIYVITTHQDEKPRTLTAEWKAANKDYAAFQTKGMPPR